MKRVIFLAIFFACLMSERIDAPVLREAIPLSVSGCAGYAAARVLYLRGYGLQGVRRGEALGFYYEARALVAGCEEAGVLRGRLEERLEKMGAPSN